MRKTFPIPVSSQLYCKFATQFLPSENSGKNQILKLKGLRVSDFQVKVTKVNCHNPVVPAVSL